ncbi:MAG: ATP-binding protein, partial [Anaerolineales bacterium]
AEQSDDITVLVVQYHGGSHNSDDRQFEMIIVNEISEIDRFQSQFAEFAAEQGIPATTMQKVQVVFEDLLANIIFYAYDDEAEHEIEISMNSNGEQLKITVVDDGLPFNPLEAEKPDTTLDLQDREIGGLGIYLVLNLMEEVTYERRGERNVITLTKKID